MKDYMGRMCLPRGSFLGLSNESLAVLTGILTGGLLCALIVGGAIVYVRHRQKTAQNIVETSSDLDDTPERRDFVKQLETLRPYAQNYLDMLNDTRRQVRELHQQGDTGAIGAYKPVIRDLAKILLLLNKPVDRAAMPEDWEHLFNWAEKTLKRCKRLSEVSQPQVAQLINFLQTPAVASPDTESSYSLRGSTTMSTFKPEQSFGSSVSLQDVAIKKFNSNYDSAFHTPLNPQWKFEYSLVSSSNPMTSSEFNPIAWRNSKEYLNNPYFLDDDFCQLGFRPQDEITTEL